MMANKKSINDHNFLLNEKMELEIKRKNLEKIINKSDIFSALSNDHKRFLLKQLWAMKVYEEMLTERIKLINDYEFQRL